MFNKILRKRLKNKLVIIGLTFMDDNHNIIELYQTAGTVKQIDSDGIIVLEKLDGNMFRLPFDKHTLSKAKLGNYTTNSGGDIISNPDYIITFDISINKLKSIEKIKLNGFEQ